jgi:hypothetical protein
VKREGQSRMKKTERKTHQDQAKMQKLKGSQGEERGRKTGWWEVKVKVKVGK